MKHIRFILFALATFGLIACTGSGPTERAAEGQTAEEGVMEDTQLKTDAKFIKAYVEQTLFSMAAAEVADDRAIDPEVRDFANTLREDHRKLYEEVVHLAENNKLPIPDETTKEMAEELEELRNADQMAFDEMYLQTVLNYHRVVTAEAEALIKNSKLEPIIDFATYIKEQQFVHLNRARELQQELDT